MWARRRSPRRICVFLRALDPGGVPRQWISLLAQHVERGGSATIVADAGALADDAIGAGIAFSRAGWESDRPPAETELARLAAGHDAAVILWDPLVISAFAPALAACSAAALALHSRPSKLAGWFGPVAHEAALKVARSATRARRGAVLVVGELHRVLAAEEFGLSPAAFDVVPASIPVQRLTFRPVTEPPGEVLALVRLSPEKSAVVRLAAELVRARRDSERPCRLALAGDGPWKREALAVCGDLLAADEWRWEPPPADPEARLAAAELVVAQGLTTFEAAALGRRVVIARPEASTGGAAGVVLTPDTYETAARDPFANPTVTRDAGRLWRDALGVGAEELERLRGLVERHNSTAGAGQALDGVLDKLVRGRRR